MNRLILAASVTIGSTASCTLNTNQPTSQVKIIGGESVDSENPMFRATVKIQNSAGGSCTGSLLDTHWILTAAHCANPDDRVDVTLNTDSNDAITIAGRFHAHSIYATNILYDIAVIYLDQPAPQGARFVNLPQANTTIEPGNAITLAGYGLQDERNHSSDGRLHQIPAQILQTYPGYHTLEVWRANPQVLQSACFGDSGGPMFQGDGQSLQQWGITSRSTGQRSGDLLCSGSVYYVDLRSFSDWVQQQTGIDPNQSQQQETANLPKPEETPAPNAGNGAATTQPDPTGSAADAPQDHPVPSADESTNNPEPEISQSDAFEAAEGYLYNMEVATNAQGSYVTATQGLKKHCSQNPQSTQRGLVKINLADKVQEPGSYEMQITYSAPKNGFISVSGLVETINGVATFQYLEEFEADQNGSISVSRTVSPSSPIVTIYVRCSGSEIQIKQLRILPKS